MYCCVFGTVPHKRTIASCHRVVGNCAPSSLLSLPDVSLDVAEALSNDKSALLHDLKLV